MTTRTCSRSSGCTSSSHTGMGSSTCSHGRPKSRTVKGDQWLSRVSTLYTSGYAPSDALDSASNMRLSSSGSVYEPLAAQYLLILFTSSKLYCIANLIGNQKIFSHLTKLGVDLGANGRHNNRCCFNVRRYLSWIEGLTTNQYVGGSNPSRRTILNSAA